jgi:hypothetical protein
MYVWLPVLFVCLNTGACEFYSGTLSVSVAQCESQNAEVKQALSLRAKHQRLPNSVHKD